MKLLRLVALSAVAVVVVRQLVVSLRAQLAGMSHPAGMFGAPQGTGHGWLRRDHVDAVGSYVDATSAVSRSWVDERALGQAAAPAGGEPVVANASEAGVVQSIEVDDVRLERDSRSDD